MTKLQITLGRVEAFAVLGDENAPETCRWLKRVLPIEGRGIHSMENGREVFVGLDDMPLPDQNQTIYQTAGDICIYYKPAIFVEPEWPRHTRNVLVIGGVYERDTAFRGMVGPVTTNAVGAITEGLDALANEAPRMRREGFEAMTISVVA